MTQGQIPSKLLHVRKDPVTIQIKDKPYEVCPEFIVSADSPRMVTLAQEWGLNRSKNCVQYETNNDPVYVDLVGLDHRGQGGRAYKVLASYPGQAMASYLDLREDVLLDILLNDGCKSMGMLQSPLIWAQFGSQMKLIRHGGILHLEIAQAQTKAQIPAIKPKDLIPGGVYMDRRKEMWLYLGLCDTQQLQHKGDSTEQKLTLRKKIQMWTRVYSMALSEVHDLITRHSIFIHFDKIKTVIECKDHVQLPEDVHGHVRACGEHRIMTEDRNRGYLCYLSEYVHACKVGDPMPRHPYYSSWY